MRRTRRNLSWMAAPAIPDLRQGYQRVRPTRKPGQSAKPIRVAITADARLSRQILAAELTLSGKTLDQVASSLGTTISAARHLINKGADYLAVAGSDNPFHEAAIAYCAARDQELRRIAAAPRPRIVIKSRWTLPLSPSS